VQSDDAEQFDVDPTWEYAPQAPAEDIPQFSLPDVTYDAAVSSFSLPDFRVLDVHQSRSSSPLASGSRPFEPANTAEGLLDLSAPPAQEAGAPTLVAGFIPQSDCDEAVSWFDGSIVDNSTLDDLDALSAFNDSHVPTIGYIPESEYVEDVAWPGESLVDASPLGDLDILNDSAANSVQLGLIIDQQLPPEGEGFGPPLMFSSFLPTYGFINDLYNEADTFHNASSSSHALQGSGIHYEEPHAVDGNGPSIDQQSPQEERLGGTQLSSSFLHPYGTNHYLRNDTNNLNYTPPSQSDSADDSFTHDEHSHLDYWASIGMGPIASSSRQTLADIQPGQCRQYLPPAGAEGCGSGVKMEDDENSPSIPHHPRDRQPCTNFRHQPYARTDKAARRKKGSTLLVYQLPIAADVFDLDAATAYCLNYQTVTCNLPLNGQPCGQVMATAFEMFMHIKAPVIPEGGAVAGHGLLSSNTQTNSHSGGQCLFPGCTSRVNSSYHRHVMAHFFRYLCPVGGCGKLESRPDEVRKHCRNVHDLTLTSTRRDEKRGDAFLVEDLAVWK